MDRKKLIRQIEQKKSFLCIGLDPDLTKIPSHLHKEKDPVFAFNKQIIDATHDLCVAYKPNIAFYESLGPQGWETLQKTMEYIPKDIFTIADAKRGDIGNTSLMYAKTFFETYAFDAVTIAPYMGKDSVAPFLETEGKWGVLLALTSNAGADDFQFHGESPLFKQVLKTSQQWGTPNNLMYVVGATRPKQLEEIREIIPEHFLLIPGVGAQGGSLKEVCKYGLTPEVGLLINSSRGIIYAGQGLDFAQKSRSAAQELQQEMQEILFNKK